MPRDPVDTNGGDGDYVAPTPREACCILEQKLSECTDASGFKPAIRTAITMYGGFFIMCKSGRDGNRITHLSLDGAGSIMVAMAVGLLEPDPGLRQRAKSKKDVVNMYLQVPRES